MPKSAAQQRANTKFEHNAYDKITVRVRKDSSRTREDIQIAANAAGESLNEYILKAVDMRMHNKIQ